MQAIAIDDSRRLPVCVLCSANTAEQIEVMLGWRQKEQRTLSVEHRMRRVPFSAVDLMRHSSDYFDHVFHLIKVTFGSVSKNEITFFPTETAVFCTYFWP